MQHPHTVLKLAMMFIIINFVSLFTLLSPATSSDVSAQTRRKSSPAPIAASNAASSVAVYRIDAAQSRVIVRAFVGGLLSSFGHDHTIAVRDFGGEVHLTPGTLESASLRINVNARSLAVVDDVSSSDRQSIEATMRNNVLEIGKYPQITFRSTAIQVQRRGDNQYQARIAGDLTLHGVTRPVIVDAGITTSGDAVRARGEFNLRQTDYKITPPSVGLGTIKVKDNLKLTFDILARR